MQKHLVPMFKGVVALAVLLVGTTVQAGSIGIKFNGGNGPGGKFGTDYPPMDPSEVAGVVPQANWNNVEGNLLGAGAIGFNIGPLTDENGVALTATSVTFAAIYTWTTGIPDAPGDSRLMGGYIDSSDSGFTIISVSGLSALTTGSYDVYVYSNGDGHGGRHGFFFLDGVLKECTDFGPFDPTVGYVEDIQDGNGGNYLHFTQVTGDTLLLLVTPLNPNDPTDNQGFRAPINAIQIVATP